MRFLVDGYNVTKRDPATAGLALAEQRDALVARLAARGATLLGRGEIVVVFDGVSGGVAGERRGPVEVRYSRDETADETIARLAVGAVCTVVTSDRELADRVRQAGATVRDAESCFEACRPIRPQRRYRASSLGLPAGANRVTEELKKLWLKDEE